LTQEEAFLDALATVDATSAPGCPIGVEQVATIAGFERGDAIRVALSLMNEGLVDGVPLSGDDEIKSVNGLELTGVGRRTLGRDRAVRFLFALEDASMGDPDAAVSAGGVGAGFGWADVEARRVADTLVDDGLVDEAEMGSDLVRMTSAGRAHLDAVSDHKREDEGMASVSINKAAIARMMGDIQHEFDKHPIRVAVRSDGSVPTGNTTTIYNGPVIHGNANGAQLAWGNDTVTQNRQEQVAPGYEILPQALVSTLQQLPAAGLPAADQEDAESAARDALHALTQGEPDAGLVRRAVAALKGHLAQLAAGLVVGAEQGAQEWAKTAIQHLQLPF
jgi:hypothetical protein